MTSKSTIVIVRHHHGDLDDIASVHLANSGFAVEHCYPFEESGPEFGLPDTASYLPAGSNLTGAVIMGGAQNVTELNKLPYLQREVEWIQSCLAAEVPVIGICLGAQLMAYALGGDVQPHSEGLCEFGYVPVYPVASVTDDSVDSVSEATDAAASRSSISSTAGNNWIEKPLHMVQAHFQGFTLPPDCTELATGTRFPHQAFHFREKAFAFQFHPEVSQSMFTEWQNAEWADEFYNAIGAQNKADASRDNQRHNQAQKEWFCSVLDRVFIAE